MNRYIKRNFKLFILTIGICLIFSLLPIYMVEIIEIISDIALNHNVERINECLIQLIIFIVFAILFANANSYMKAHLRNKLNSDLSCDLYNRLLSMNYAKFKQKSIGTYLAYFTNDVKMVDERYFQTFVSLMIAFFQLVVVFLYIGNINFLIAFMMLVISVLTMSIPKLMSKK
ncbi:MAG: ABC transporter transmembrane domain-containing protein, partial [Longicatena sp.]